MTQYYSNTKEDYVNINDMHHQHVWYAFKKLCDRLEELGICEHIWEDSYNVTTYKKKDYVRKDVYELLFDKATRQDNTIEHLLNENSKLKKKFDKAVSELFEGSKSKTNANSKSVFKLEKKVSELSSKNNVLTMINMEMKEKVEKQGKTINRLFNDQKHIGHRYVFSNIPNTEEGRQTVHKLRKWLNKDTYNMRVRGQYLDKTKLSEGESWRTYDDGQPLSKSKCIRLYIDKKKESA